MSEPPRKFYFMWIAKCTGTPFVVEGYAVVYKCPICGKEDAFERGHCVRIQRENLFGGIQP